MEFTAPAVNYRATALRPQWTDLPSVVRQLIEERLGLVTRCAVPGSGFTPAFAATVTTDRGAWFVKAAPSATPFGDAAEREARVLAHMPSGLPVPRLCWSAHTDDWVVLCLEVVDGHMPGQPWTLDDATAVLTAQAVVAQALATPPPGLADAVADKNFAEFADTLLRTWRNLATGTSLATPLPEWITRNLDDLAALEQHLVELSRDQGGVMHLDARPDNTLVHGRTATLVDWNFAMTGPAFPDVVDMLQTLHGHPDINVDGLLAEHPVTRDLPADTVDAALAGIGGFLLANSEGSHVETSPMLRTHQRATGVRTLTWLADRRGWRKT